MALKCRTIDGSDNNLSDPTLNQANTDFARVGPANFALTPDDVVEVERFEALISEGLRQAKTPAISRVEDVPS
jgi:hypothetical protein